MQTPGIREQQFIVFWNRQRPAFLDGWANVRLVNWKHDIAGDNLRERMLAAFVLGTAAMNKFTFTIPSMQLRKVAYADIGGIRAFKVTANPTFSTAADWMNLVIDNA
jgi:hypothetical protein